MDRNLLAVDLLQVAPWIEGSPAAANRRPFSTTASACSEIRWRGRFDLGVLDDGIPDDAYKPATDDDKRRQMTRRCALQNKTERETGGR